MLIELRSRCPVRLWWADWVECAVTQSRLSSLVTIQHRTLGWVVVNGIVDSDRALVELVNPFYENIREWSSNMDDFATEAQARRSLLTRVRTRLCEDAVYCQWAIGAGNTGHTPRPDGWITERETW